MDPFVAAIRTSVMIVVLLAVPVNCHRPSVVKVGTVFTFDSVIGRAAKMALQVAISDVNADSSVLNETSLRLVMEDSDCSVFRGTFGAFQVLEKEVVAMIGPISSSIAHTLSEIAKGLQVPLVSFAATDPTLSALQFPYFIRTTPDDARQMAAMADLIEFYGWKEVVSVFSDDELGRNGVTALDDELYKKRLKLSYKIPIPITSNENFITSALNRSKSFGSRVYVLHFNPDPSLRIFRIAQKLQMMTRDYAWLTTDWLSVTLDSSAGNASMLTHVEGVVGLREYIPESTKKREFMQKMKEKGAMNAYALHAYDAVWTIAYGIEKLLNDRINVSFSPSQMLLRGQDTKSQLKNIKIFNNGNLLLKNLLRVNFKGIAGQVQFGYDRTVVGGDYEIINLGQTGVLTVGFWSKNGGLSIKPPQQAKRQHRNDQRLRDVIWPGGSHVKPRGWTIADSTESLKIVVPRRASFVEFATEHNRTHQMQGYCIDLFRLALKFVPYNVPYTFEPFGDGLHNPDYDQMLQMVADNVYDAAVGDIAIVPSRMKWVDFSQPYTSMGLVVVIPAHERKSDTWSFLRPFTIRLWCVVVASFFFIAIVIWVLEHRVNDAFRGPPRKQLVTMILFSFSTLFKKNQEETVSNLARLVMIVWLFLLMVLTSNYTANLTSILTVQQLPSPITGIDSLLVSSWPVGYHTGSFTYQYLTDNLGMARSRLVALGSPEDYERALRLGPGSTGGVAAIVDELPYIELFLSKRTGFKVVGEPFMRRGWGFAFKRDSALATDISTAILKLSETGKIKELGRKWFCRKGCSKKREWGQEEEDQIHLQSFKGLYLICSCITVLAFAAFLLRLIRQFVRFKRMQMTSSLSRPSTSSSSSSVSPLGQLVFGFFDFVDEKEEAVKRFFRSSGTNDNQQAPSTS